VRTRDSALSLQLSYIFRETLVDVLHPAGLLFVPSESARCWEARLAITSSTSSIIGGGMPESDEVIS
jgi:hypothetical protein